MAVIGLSVLMGLGLGCIFYAISLFQIQSRTADIGILRKAKQKSSAAIYVCLSAVGFGFIGAIVSSTSKYEIMTLFCICLCIGWIDWQIRIIPNELLLSLILCKIVFLIVDRQLGFLLQGLIGLGAGLVVFLIPSLLGMQIGAGDIKYAAVVGFYLGAIDFIQVMLIMAAGLFVYLIYLLITKKGSWKTAAAIGPYISLGVLFTAIFPII